MRNRPDSRRRLAGLHHVDAAAVTGSGRHADGRRPADESERADRRLPVDRVADAEDSEGGGARRQRAQGSAARFEGVEYRPADGIPAERGGPASDPVERRMYEPRFGGWTPDAGDRSVEPARSTDRLPAPGRGRRLAEPVDSTDPSELERRTWASSPPEPEEQVSRSGGPVAVGSAHRARQMKRSSAHTWGRMAQRWVPEPLRDSRVDPGRRGALLLTVIAAVAALVAAVGVWRDRPEPRPVQAVSLAQVSESQSTPGRTPSTASLGRVSGHPRTPTAGKQNTAGSSSPTVSSAAAATVIVVSVTGAVHRPGLVRLTAGSRVADAIDKAGGTTGSANTTGLNLAAKLTDGSSVVVADANTGSASRSSISGAEGDSGGAAPTIRPIGGKVDLNTADAAALDALPGVGPVTAASIVAWRDKNGSYTSVDQLQEIAGIGPAKFAALAALVKV